MNPIELYERKILVLTGEGAHRENLAKGMRIEGFNVAFVTATVEVLDLINDMKPRFFLHDWTISNDSQCRQLQFRLNNLKEYRNLVRIILVPEISPEILACAADTGCAKVLPLGTATLNLIAQIRMILSAKGESKEIEDFLEAVRFDAQSYSQEKLDQKIREAHEKFPDDPGVKLEFGNLSIRSEKLEEAVEIGDQILAKQPTNVRAMNLKARALMKMNKMTDAIAVLEQADQLSPKSPDRLALLGDAFFSSGDNLKAKDYYSAASKEDPNNKDANVGLGKIALSEGDADQAIALFRSSLSEDEAASFFNNAGVAAVKASKVPEALKLYETALRSLKTTNFRHQILYNIALAFMKQGETEKARRALQRAVKVKPQFEKAKKLLESIDKAV